jgi:hypothetical protein
MKVLDLVCDSGHRFEGWFGSEDDYRHQMQRRLIECPVCASLAIERLPSAPRLNLGGSSSSPLVPNPSPEHQSVEALWQQAVEHVLRQTENVGDRFAEEARRIHYGETERRSIRGSSSAGEIHDLIEEGIEVVPIPGLPGRHGPLQ